ncbi:hypothetical protein JXD38_04700 [candidate division WOR-3 bacterium]|nr:hypothetical protein [candidate division WOR-3 bacterium]
MSAVLPDRRAPRAGLKQPFPFHQFLFAVVPALFLYSHNVTKIPVAPGELILPLVLSLVIALVLWWLLRLVLGNSRRAALIVSLFLILFFNYGRVVGAVGQDVPPGFPRIGAAAILLIGIIIFGLTRREFAGLTIFLNLASLALVLVNLVTGFPALQRSREASRDASRSTTQPTAGKPDIYYVILDGYARNDILKSIYDHDNSEFTNWLEARGFQVARRSRSNYSQTYLSLASSLNMTYLDLVADKVGPESQDRSRLIRMIGDSRVVKELRQRGYTIVSFASGYTGTDLKNADTHFAPRWALSEFQNVFISTTALPLLLDRVLKKSQYDLHRERILYAFEHLPDAARLKRPVFVFCHIVSPHPPFVFGARGEKTEPQGYFTMTEGGMFQAVDREKVRREYVEKYRAQLQFINAKTKTMVERILAASPQPPVIILQGDHGPGSVLNWNDPAPEDLVERFAILNAYHIPGQSPIPESISPVNSFRLLFDRLFATDYAALPDQSLFSTIAEPWRFYHADRPTEYAKRDAGSGISVVAYRGELQVSDPATYCRRLVSMLYPGRTVTIERFYVQGLHIPVESAEDAYQHYRNAVASSELPDLGTEHESYCGPGPDRIPVTALFFSDSTP